MTVPEERETVVNTSDGDDEVRIWTAQRPYITRLRRNPKFVETKSGRWDGTEWAEFVIARAQWSPDSGAKQVRNLSSDQKSALAERMRQARSVVVPHA
jgi:hypothetical protein